MSELRLTVTGTYTRDGRTLPINPGAYTVAELVAPGCISGNATAPTAAAAAVPLGGVVPGIVVIQNLDAENGIAVGYDDGSFQRVMTVPPGLPVVITADELFDAPYVQADDADALYAYWIVPAPEVES